MQIGNLTADRIWDYENGFYWFSPTERIGKLLAHYELYKKILDLPGDIVEFGVHKGASLVRFATFRNILEHEASRSIVGFDTFGTFPVESGSSDETFVRAFSAAAGDACSKDNVGAVLAHKGIARNIKLIEGDIHDTLPRFLEESPQARFSLVHIDVDIYAPSKVILDSCASRVVRGGLLVFDDYPIVDGETRAVDEFLKENPQLSISKSREAHRPSYIQMP